MLRMLFESDKELILQNPGKTVGILRIRAIYKAYGTDKSFVRFYGNEDGSILICLHDSLAILHIDGKNQERVKELSKEAQEFLPLIARTIMSEIPLSLEGFVDFENYECYDGKIFEMSECRKKLLLVEEFEKIIGGEITKNNIRAGYELISKVFPDDVNESNYESRYADFSHRIRHGMSTLFTLNGKATATIFLCEDKTAMLSQVCTAIDMRKKGLGLAIIRYAAKAVDADRLVLLSQNSESDGFYAHLGFEQIGQWYCYET